MMAEGGMAVPGGNDSNPGSDDTAWNATANVQADAKWPPKGCDNGLRKSEG